MSKQHLIYLRENGHPIACVAINSNGADSGYQLSIVDKRDHFDKVLARKIAIGRLGKKPIAIDLSADTNFFNTAKVVIQTLSENKNVGHRARLAAKQYLKDAELGNIIIDLTPNLGEVI